MGTNAHNSLIRRSPKRAQKVGRASARKLAGSSRGGAAEFEAALLEDLEKELAEYRRTERLIHDAYDESQRMIMDLLHEDIGQRFTGIALLAGVLYKGLMRESHPLAQKAHDVAASVGECIALVRDLARGVYPTSLHSEGLGPALESLAERIQTRFKIPCQVSRKPATIFASSHSLQIYRIVEIAILAAIKNHGADSIAIEYGKRPNSGSEVKISYHDLKPSTVAAKVDEELQLLRSRARIIGASVRIRSGKKRAVTIQLPPT